MLKLERIDEQSSENEISLMQTKFEFPEIEIISKTGRFSNQENNLKSIQNSKVAENPPSREVLSQKIMLLNLNKIKKNQLTNHEASEGLELQNQNA